MPDQPVAAPRPTHAATQRSTTLALGRTLAAAVIAALVIIPDREIAAKMFKAGLILDNVKNRALGSS